MSDQFRALYYPYSRCLHQVDLKRAVLVFDELLFVDPLSEDVEAFPGQSPVGNPQILARGRTDDKRKPSTDRALDSRQPAWFDVAKAYKSLSESRIARLVQPQDYVIASDNFITYAVVRDLLEGLPQEYGTDDGYFIERIGFGWRLHKSRIPKGLLGLAEDRVQLSSLVDETIAGPAIRWRNREFTLKYLQDCLAAVSIAVARAPADDVVLPFGVAYSLIVNQALVISDELQAFPITDDVAAHSSLVKKIERVYASTMNSPYSEIGIEPTGVDRYKIQVFTQGIVSRLIPDEALDCLEMDEIIAYRMENADPLKRFHQRMMEIALTVTADPWQKNFRSEVLAAIEGKVAPEIRKIDDELQATYEKMFGSSAAKMGAEFAKILAPALPTLTMAAFLGLSGSAIVALGAAGALSALGIALPDFVTYIHERRKLRRNGLAYLLAFRKQAMDH